MKITIDIDHSLEQAKERYRTHHAMPDNAKVTRADLAIFFACLIEGDLDSIHGDESE